MLLHASVAWGNLEPGAELLLTLVLDASATRADASDQQLALPVELEYVACCVAGAWRADPRWVRPNAHRARPATGVSERSVVPEMPAADNHGASNRRQLGEQKTSLWDWESEALGPDILDGPDGAEESAPWLAALWDLMEAAGYPVCSATSVSHLDTLTHRGLIFASRACNVTGRILLDSTKPLAFLVRGRLPSMLPPSFDGKYVRYRYGVGVVAQCSGQAPVKLHLPFRIRPWLVNRLGIYELGPFAQLTAPIDAVSDEARSHYAPIETKAVGQQQQQGRPHGSEANLFSQPADGDASMFDVVAGHGGFDVPAAKMTHWPSSPPLVPQMSPSWSERRVSSPSVLALSPSMPHSPIPSEAPHSVSSSHTHELGRFLDEDQERVALFPLRMDLKAIQIPMELSANLESILSATANGRLTAYPTTTAPNDWDESASGVVAMKLGAQSTHSDSSASSELEKHPEGVALATDLPISDKRLNSASVDRFAPRWTSFVLQVEAAGIGHISSVRLGRNCFALGESVPICVDWSASSCACVFIRGTLESVEILHPRQTSAEALSWLERNAKTGAEAATGALCHRRCYAQRAEPCTGLRSWQWSPVLPQEEDTPVSFATRAVQLQWMLRIQFLLPKQHHFEATQQQEMVFTRKSLTLVSLPIPLFVGGAFGDAIEPLSRGSHGRNAAVSTEVQL